jgi:endoglucanase
VGSLPPGRPPPARHRRLRPARDDGKAGEDYVARTGTLTFAPGETTKTITIEVKGDCKKESDETFSLDLVGLSSNALFTKSRGLGSILKDD